MPAITSTWDLTSRRAEPVRRKTEHDLPLCRRCGEEHSRKVDCSTAARTRATEEVHETTAMAV